MFQFEESFYKNRPILAKRIALLKSEKMTLQQFRESFSQELDLIEIYPDVEITLVSSGKQWQYRGPALAVRAIGKHGHANCFPFPDANQPDAPIPPEVFDYLARFWS